MDTRAISYRDTYVPVPAITRPSWRWKKGMLTLAVLALTTMVYFELQSFLKPNMKRKTPQRFYHSNPCQHLSPEPEVILQEIFDSSDIFFPQSYKERKCVAPSKQLDNTDEGPQTCFGDQYHCITRYKKLDVIRIPYPGNGTFEQWSTETVHAAVACECSGTERVKTYETDLPFQ